MHISCDEALSAFDTCLRGNADAGAFLASVFDLSSGERLFSAGDAAPLPAFDSWAGEFAPLRSFPRGALAVKKHPYQVGNIEAFFYAFHLLLVADGIEALHDIRRTAEDCHIVALGVFPSLFIQVAMEISMEVTAHRPEMSTIDASWRKATLKMTAWDGQKDCWLKRE